MMLILHSSPCVYFDDGCIDYNDCWHAEWTFIFVFALFCIIITRSSFDSTIARPCPIKESQASRMNFRGLYLSGL